MAKLCFRFVVWAVVVYGLLWVGWTLRGAEPVKPPDLPTFRWIQEELNRRRNYNLKVDGKIGAKTLAAWEKEIGHQFAKPYFRE